jgi:RNA polymerase sigma-70 factor (ECF subfamily)
METSEKELIAAARAGDKPAFNRLVTKYRDKMFALTYRMTGDREAALDLVQEVFFTVYKEIHRFREEAGLATWLYRIAANKTLNYLKRKKIVSFISLSAAAARQPVYEITDDLEKAELSRRLQQAVAALPPKQRLAFNLRFYERMPFKEIAAAMNTSESTVKTNYQRAVEKLRKELKDYR